MADDTTGALAGGRVGERGVGPKPGKKGGPKGRPFVSRRIGTGS